MSSRGKESATTFRLGEALKYQLEKTALILRRSKNQVVEDALSEYFKNHGFNERYVASIYFGHVVLLKLDGEKATVLDVQEMNGVPAQKVAEKYAAHYQVPVDLIVQGEKP